MPYNIMVNKKQVSWTIEEDILEKIDRQAAEEERSSSYIANRYLKEAYKVREK